MDATPIDNGPSSVSALANNLALAMKERNRLLAACELVLENITAPEKNCRCHVAPPCNDCVENEGKREALKAVREAVDEATSPLSLTPR